MSLLIKLVPFPETWKKITYCHLILKWTCIVYTLCTSISFKWTWISSALGGTSTKLGQRTTPNNNSLQDCTILVSTQKKQEISALNLFRYDLIFFVNIQLLFPKIKSVIYRGKVINYVHYILLVTQPGTFTMPLEPEILKASHLRTPSYRCPVSPEIYMRIEKMFAPRLINKGNAREVYLILRRLVNAIK